MGTGRWTWTYIGRVDGRQSGEENIVEKLHRLNISFCKGIDLRVQCLDLVCGVYEAFSSPSIFKRDIIDLVLEWRQDAEVVYGASNSPEEL